MGNYFNPPHGIKTLGRKLITFTDYDSMYEQLKPDEILMGYYDRGIFQQTVHLFSAEEFADFEQQEQDGFVYRLGFYALASCDFDFLDQPKPKKQQPTTIEQIYKLKQALEPFAVIGRLEHIEQIQLIVKHGDKNYIIIHEDLLNAAKALDEL